MKKHTIISLLICLCLIIGLINIDAFAGAPSFNMPSGMVLVSQINYTLAPGVIETHLETTNTAGNTPVHGYVITIDLTNNAKIVANYGSYYKYSDPEQRTITSWKCSRTTSQAGRYATATGENVIVATNADYYKMSTGRPLGALVLEGKTYHEASGRPYFAILKDGSAVIRDAGADIGRNVVEAVGGSLLLVKNGAVASGVPVTDTKRSPCNTIGLKQDGTVVLFLADGRDNGESEGLTYLQQAQMLIALGCVTAMQLDGGGSATIATKHRDSSSLTIQNNPSDGKERAVSSTLMVVACTPAPATATPKATAKPTKKPSSKATPKPTAKPTAKSSDKSNRTVNTGQTKANPTATPKPTSKPFKSGNNYYRITSKKNKTVSFTGTVKRSPQKIIIPKTIKHSGIIYKVTTISKKACYNNTKLKHLVIGKNILKIGKKAFKKCLSLKTVKGYKYVNCTSFSDFYKKYVE